MIAKQKHLLSGATEAGAKLKFPSRGNMRTLSQNQIVSNIKGSLFTLLCHKTLEKSVDLITSQHTGTRRESRIVDSHIKLNDRLQEEGTACARV